MIEQDNTTGAFVHVMFGYSMITNKIITTEGTVNPIKLQQVMGPE